MGKNWLEIRLISETRHAAYLLIYLLTIIYYYYLGLGEHCTLEIFIRTGGY